MKSLKEKEGSLISRLSNSSVRELAGVILLIITFGFIVYLRNPAFLSLQNIKNLLQQIVVYGILACAVAFPMINGTFDLSCSAICGLGGACCALMVTTGLYGLHLPMWLAVVVAILICCVFGAINGFIVSRTEIPPFIVTLGTDTAIRGIIYIVCNNSPVSNLPEEFKFLGSAHFFGVPLNVILMFLVFFIVGFVLKGTSFGRKIYANGGNYQAAYFSGVNTKRIRMMTYVISAALAGFAGILMTARVGSATPNAGNNYATYAISACAMGGVPLGGGAGSALGIFLGSVMIGMISNGMNLMFITSNWQMVVRGVIMIAAVYYSMAISMGGSGKFRKAVAKKLPQAPEAAKATTEKKQE
ncbi:MAG: ABC transporter permease [Oscillospiraceae bacterium]|nr:ABC transporter permease [Oscillospiraceae bacterium]